MVQESWQWFSQLCLSSLENGHLLYLKNQLKHVFCSIHRQRNLIFSLPIKPPYLSLAMHKSGKDFLPCTLPRNTTILASCPHHQVNGYGVWSKDMWPRYLAIVFKPNPLPHCQTFIACSVQYSNKSFAKMVFKNWFL